MDSIRRCVLVNYNKDTKLLDFRHYLIKLAPVGISRSIKKLIRPKLPNMSRFETISEYIERGGNLSESEGEMDGPHNEVTLPQEVRGRGNIKATQSAVRLKEVGPRLTLQLVKIEEGICDGAVLFHAFVKKSVEETESIKAMREKKRILKEKRKREQLENVKKKALLREENKKKSLQGIKNKQAMKRQPQNDSDQFPKGKKRKVSEEG
ncbi:hypothetical protein C0Q70_01047 [Pomacea canaliculata]|uniref:Brix domain-containing protein n=2 Tax=Pomacea canaliculata TaxID=400727 RepID=A0A2T7PYC8_POMCA|nr:hypothetical protein C0Q70_01047 [Pomacea canaliculata]